MLLILKKLLKQQKNKNITFKVKVIVEETAQSGKMKGEDVYEAYKQKNIDEEALQWIQWSSAETRL